LNSTDNNPEKQRKMSGNQDSPQVRDLGEELSNLQIALSNPQVTAGTSQSTVSDVPTTPTSTQTDPNPATLVCFCGDAFETIDQLRGHAVEKGHRMRCGCGALRGSWTLMKQHQHEIPHAEAWTSTKLAALDGASAHEPSPQPLTCVFCPGKKWTKPVALHEHHRLSHPRCPTCSTVFHDMKAGKQVARTAADQVTAHQEAAEHCYCADHQMAFRSVFAYEEHLARHSWKTYQEPQECPGQQPHRRFVHECVSCDEKFRSVEAYRRHLASDAHTQSKEVVGDDA